MDEVSLLRLWLMRFGFAFLVLAILFFHLLPLETTPRRWAGPDLVLGFAFAWVLRRPEYTPVLMVAGLLLLADLLLGRPPGLYAALSLIAFNKLSARRQSLSTMPFSVEWITVSFAFIAVMLGYRLILSLLLVNPPGPGLFLSQLTMTVLTYPVIVLISRYAFGLRAVGLGEINALGQRQ
ncbi:rod shape-determining protein MreD [Rhodobacteraceae bacterium LMO-12]|nr:rod shape-determining protein MreD [Rhodobacteraceae bacterium LMO-JJ12]